MTALAVNQILFCDWPMYRPVLERKLVRYVPRTMPPGMTPPQAGLIETVDFGDAPFQVDSVALAALITILLVGRAVSGQPGIRMFRDAA